VSDVRPESSSGSPQEGDDSRVPMPSPQGDAGKRTPHSLLLRQLRRCNLDTDSPPLSEGA
jgi:hypothetical protein